jgi:hypothetical protein
LYQPLDRKVFEELKSQARYAFFQLAAKTGVQGAAPEEVIII